jgi:hypothetical protein
MREHDPSKRYHCELDQLDELENHQETSQSMGFSVNQDLMRNQTYGSQVNQSK